MFFHNHFSKLILFCFSILLAICALQIPCLEAGGWGKTEEVMEYEGAAWNGVYFNMNGLSFTASMPNYSSAILQNGSASLQGKVEEDSGYAIITSLNPEFTAPKSSKKFIKLIQEANPEYRVAPINSKKKFGSKYAVDLIPINQDGVYWRFLSTDDRLIKMGTADANVNRRHRFFDSIIIK